jgi:hypothetical protein
VSLRRQVRIADQRPLAQLHRATRLCVCWVAMCAMSCADPSLDCEPLGDGPPELMACKNSARDDCPIGLECVPSGLPNRGCTPPEWHCAAPRREDDAATRGLLARGFRVQSVQLRRLETEADSFPRFTWDPPKHAWMSACALFGCAPQFASGKIHNAEQCVLREQWWKPVPATIDVRDVRPFESKQQRPAVNFRFGCWIYSQVGMIGATPLERLAPDEVPEPSSFVSDCATDNHNGCIVSRESRYLGRCNENDCVRSCLSNEDCGDPELLRLADDAGIRSDSGPDLCVGESIATAGLCTARAGAE